MMRAYAAAALMMALSPAAVRSAIPEPAAAPFALQSSPPLLAPYRGPPRFGREYDHGFPTYMGCMTTFALHEPLEKAFGTIIEQASLDFLRQDMPRRPVTDHVEVDERKRTLTVSTRGYARTARYYPGYGCALLPPGQDDIYVKLDDPATLAPDPAIAAAAGKAWPIGEHVDPAPADAFDRQGLATAMDMLFTQDSSTQAVLVIKGGRIILERYGASYGPQSRFFSFSMTKSITATLFGLVQHDGLANVQDTPPFPEWAGEGDPRRAIRIGDLMRMSSGLDIPKDEEPWTHTGPVNPEDELYGNAIDINLYSLQQRYWKPPEESGRYREMNPQLVAFAAQRLLATRKQEWRGYLQRRLFDPLHIGPVDFVIDAFGNPYAYAFALMRPRDWARLGMLYLNRGQWFGKQLIGKDFVDFVSTPAPGWIKDQQPSTFKYGITYGAGFWVAHPGTPHPGGYSWVPKGSFMMLGYGDQSVIIMPSRDTIIVRLGDVPGSTEKMLFHPPTGKLENAEIRVIEPALKILASAIR